MIKKIIFITALSVVILLLIWFFLSYKKQWQEKQLIKPTIQACENSGGEWKTLGSPCQNDCDYQRRTLAGEQMACIAVESTECLCEENKCWDGLTCIPL